MSFQWVASILREHPPKDRPELMLIEAYYGVILASNAHVILMAETELPCGVYDYVIGGKLPNRMYPSKVDRMLEIFSISTSPIPDAPKKLRASYAAFPGIDVQLKYWNLVKDGAHSLRVGRDNKLNLVVMTGVNQKGAFCIAGLK